MPNFEKMPPPPSIEEDDTGTAPPYESVEKDINKTPLDIAKKIIEIKATIASADRQLHVSQEESLKWHIQGIPADIELAIKQRNELDRELKYLFAVLPEDTKKLVENELDKINHDDPRHPELLTPTELAEIIMKMENELNDLKEALEVRPTEDTNFASHGVKYKNLQALIDYKEQYILEAKKALENDN